MIVTTLISIPASIFEWVMDNIPALGIFLFIGWCIWKYISWLNGKFSHLEQKSEARFVQVENSIHKLDTRVAILETKVDTALKVQQELLARVIALLESQMNRYS